MLRRGSIVSAKIYSKGNVPYEINIQAYTTLTSLCGSEEWKNIVPTKIDFQQIKSKQGFISKLIFNFNLQIRIYIYIFNSFRHRRISNR